MRLNLFPEVYLVKIESKLGLSDLLLSHCVVCWGVSSVKQEGFSGDIISMYPSLLPMTLGAGVRGWAALGLGWIGTPLTLFSTTTI